MGEAGYFAMFVAVGAMWVALLTGPVGQAIARRISGRAVDPKTGLSTGEMAAERIAELEARLADLEAAQGRVLELEERVDFAERILTRGHGVEPASDDAVPTPR